MSEFAQTEKQTEIMKLILEAADYGAFINMTQLRERLTYKASKQAFLCSVKILENYGFLVKEYKGSRPMELKPTPLAYATFRTSPTVL
jgi:repressor of nif and glnA expression